MHVRHRNVIEIETGAEMSNETERDATKGTKKEF